MPSSPAGARVLAFPEATPTLPSGILGEHGTCLLTLPAFCSVRRKLANPFLLPRCLLLLVAAGNSRTFVSCSTWQPLPKCCLLEETPPHPVAAPSSGALCSGAVTPYGCSQASCPALAPCAPRLYCWGGLRSGLTCSLLPPPIHSPQRPQSFYVAFLMKTC